MENSLADQDRAITISPPEPTSGACRRLRRADIKPSVAARRARKPSDGLEPGSRRQSSPASRSRTPEDFYRDLVWNLRNGVLAVTRDGRIAVMNDVAYRILGLKPRTTDIGRPFTEVLKDVPDMTRILAGAFELSHLPNRAELRLKTTGKVIGYTLSQVRDRARPADRRDALLQGSDPRRAARRTRAAARPAGGARRDGGGDRARGQEPARRHRGHGRLLKRQLTDSQDAQTILADIIKEAKMANAIVVEVLEFVRPIRLQVERVSLGRRRSRDAISLAESARAARRGRDRRSISPTICRRSRAIRTSCGSCSPTC